ncbi:MULTISPECIES: class I SAM-dependent methyltransferase [unclassified Moorena]|uniref:class I SAM-dependent methyltransferase n=1 Tax=unclassified Moorena TaxID=2683338 RepID=UPI0013C8A119|nr:MULTISPECIES: class I SAM-dependent methyltransferase [unclassified Moorena]NEO20775.1 class I SAM-dependent methyltransferase [Moorena sp. SIO4A5]NEQ60051.1 class I SAM-dependent methyltransferase [Moorena sp. SIO4A1]
MNTLSNHNCPVCASADLEVFFEMLAVPVYCNLLWRSRQTAQNCSKGDIKLGFCPSCGFISNLAFDPTKLGYSQDYENSLHYSARFQDYAQSLAAGLVKRHHLYNKDIIEIGCGKGDFLISLCELGNNRGVGFDPSYVPRSEHQQLQTQVKFVQDFYSQLYQEYQADLICCRHTLEHISNPADLLKPLRQAIGSRLNTIVLFEVPNALDTFRHLAVWDIIYEHCCYFAPTSLGQAFVNAGFQVSEIKEAFGGQFLCLEAKPVHGEIPNSYGKPDEIEVLTRDIASFTARFQEKLESWQHKLTTIAQTDKKAVAWGAGSKGVTFLNLLKCQDVIDDIVDLNPRKQGKYVAGTGQEIVPPEFLQDYQPDLVIVMNPIYEEEIRQLCNNLGLTPELICV